MAAWPSSIRNLKSAFRKRTCGLYLARALFGAALGGAPPPLM